MSAQNRGKDGGGGANASHGLEFHLNLAMLLVLRLLELKQSDSEFEYQIWLEKAGYGKFDDIVLKYKKGSSKWIQICFQCKSGEEKIAANGFKFVSKVSAQDFLSDKKTSFSLLEYIKSFSQIKDTMKDCDSYYVLITNREYSCDKDSEYSFLQRDEIDFTSAQMFSNILVAKAFKIKYNLQFREYILKLNKKKDINLDSKTIETFCEKFLFVCDNRELDVELHDKMSVCSNGNKEKTINWLARLRSIVLDMYQRKVEPAHSDFLNLLNCINIYYKNQPAHPRFTGRLEEIKNIKSAMLNNKRGNILDLLVTGMAGMGKTQVVRKYIEDNMHQFKHIIWLNAENKDTLDSSFVDLARTCQLSKEDGKHEIGVVIKAVYDYFSEQTLFVFDNADEALQLQGNPGEYIYLPNNAASCGRKFIVISQSTKWTTGHAVTLKTYSEEEAVLYLDEVFDCTREEKKDIAASVQYWPLALCLAASYIKLETDNSLGRKSLSDVIQTIKKDNVNLHTHLPQQYEMEPYNASLRSLWQLIQANLKTKSDLALNILHILSFSSPDNFPIELLKYHSCNEDQVLRAISILRDNSLVTIADYNMSIHRALQAVVRNSITSDPNFQNDILVLGIKSFEKYLFAMNEIECRITVGNIHMLTFLQHVRESQIQLQTYVKMAALLFHKFVESYDVLILGKENNIFEEMVLKSTQNLGVKCKETQYMLSTKARMLHRLGIYDEAISIYNQVIEVRTETLGKNHPSTLTSMGNKAIELECMDKFDEALIIYNYVIDVITKTLGIDHSDLLPNMHNKASVLHKMGNYDEALLIYNRVIELQTEILGKNHPNTLTCMSNKALVLDTLGKYDEALIICNYVIEVQTELLGEDHPDTLSGLRNKAAVLNKIGKYDEALCIYNHVIDVQTEKFGKNYKSTLVSMHKKASMLDAMGKYDEALSIYNYVIVVETDKLGKDHLNTLIIMNNKASVLNKMEKYDEALSIYNHVIEVRTEKLGWNHSDTINSMNDKALVCYNMEKYEEALSIHNHVIEVETERLGKDHPDTLTIMQNKASVLVFMGKYDEALSIYNHVIEVQTEKLDKNHPSTLISMQNKASVLVHMEKYDNALIIYNHVIEVQTEKLGGDHPNIQASISNRAILLEIIGKNKFMGFMTRVKNFFVSGFDG